MAEELRTLNADLLAIRGALEAAGPAGIPAAALRGKLAQEFLAAVHGFHARFAQCRRMQAVSPSELEARLQEVSGDPGCWFYIGCTRALTHYLWEARPWCQAWQRRAAGYEKTWTYYCRPGPGSGLCTVRHLLVQFCGTHPRCLNVSHFRNGPVSIVFLVTYAQRGSRPGEPAEDMEVALRGIAAHFHHRGAPADELVQFLKDDFRQLMGRYPGYLAQCRAMSQIPPARFPGRAREILAGLGPAEGVLAGTVPDGVISMRPCLWEVGAGEAQAGEKLHTYFTRLDGSLDAKRLLEEIWGHPRCLDSRRRWGGRSGTQPGAFLYLAIFRGPCVPGGP
ncbi:uncharacterized protein LOC135983279 [Chrysemys picta bellii]|uniref:uncharacterized protein LOC135983279 n=1 Tax=Chrysemys picta bellii TaxID=8478 RepID=UPI0032B1EB62